MKKKHIISIVLTAFILVSCGKSTRNTYTTPQQINEPQIAEITPIFETQIERVNNCDGTNPTYNVSYKTIETQKATFEISVGAGGLVTGTPIPSALEVQLEAKITAALAKDYGLTAEKNHDMTLENPPGTYLEHTIEWEVTRVKGLVEVIYGDGVAQVVFEKIANVELYNRTSVPLGCNGSDASALSTIVNSSETPITILEPQPTLAPQPTSSPVPQAPPSSRFTAGQLLYEEIFDNASAWILEGNRIEDGNLIIVPDNDAVPQDSDIYTDFILESRFYVPTSGSMAFYLRHQNPPCDDWNCSIQIVLYYGSNNSLAARRFLGASSGKQEDIKSGNISSIIKLNEWNTISVAVRGNTYEITLNETLVFDFVDNTYTSGAFIIDNAGPDEVKIDYVRIYAIQ